MKKYLLLFLLLFNLACTQDGFRTMNSSEIGVFEASSESVQILIEGPDEVPYSGAEYNIRVQPENSVRAARLKINQQLHSPILRLPLTHQVNWQEAEGLELTLEVQLLDGRWMSHSKILRRSQSAGGTGDRKDPNCMNNPDFDACVFLKNPVHHEGRALSQRVRIGQNLSQTQTYGVKLRGLSTPNQLRNPSYTVMASSGLLAQPENGSWKFEYQQDSGKHYVAQLMAYYYLQLQLETMKQKTNVMYTENKGITVDAFSRNTVNNAYWYSMANKIVMGVFSEQEASLSAEILVHEAAHANFDFATNKTLSITSGTCPNAEGCIGAIHEGQADFHLAMMFRNDPALSQTITNSLAGWSNRDPRNFPGRAQDVFNISGGQVHAMGALFSYVLYQIYTDSRTDASAFEKTFVAHLARLQSSSNFTEAKSHLLAVDQHFYQGRNSSIIEEKFQAVGL